ncbi:MAG: hypothetical protein RL266_2303 [Bacteroidota bacterium]|jgi:hypothetical protein
MGVKERPHHAFGRGSVPVSIGMGQWNSDALGSLNHVILEFN